MDRQSHDQPSVVGLAWAVAGRRVTHMLKSASVSAAKMKGLYLWWESWNTLEEDKPLLLGLPSTRASTEPPSSLYCAAAPPSQPNPGVWAFPCHWRCSGPQPDPGNTSSTMHVLLRAWAPVLCDSQSGQHRRDPTTTVGTPPAPWGPHCHRRDMQVVPSRAHQHMPLGQHPPLCSQLGDPR